MSRVKGNSAGREIYCDGLHRVSPPFLRESPMVPFFPQIFLIQQVCSNESSHIPFCTLDWRFILCALGTSSANCTRSPSTPFLMLFFGFLLILTVSKKKAEEPCSSLQRSTYAKSLKINQSLDNLWFKFGMLLEKQTIQIQVFDLTLHRFEVVRNPERHDLHWIKVSWLSCFQSLAPQNSVSGKIILGFVPPTLILNNKLTKRMWQLWKGTEYVSQLLG